MNRKSFEIKIKIFLKFSFKLLINIIQSKKYLEGNHPKRYLTNSDEQRTPVLWSGNKTN